MLEAIHRTKGNSLDVLCNITVLNCEDLVDIKIYSST